MATFTSTKAYVANNTGGSVTCTTPAASAAGMRLYFFYAEDNAGGTLTAPAGSTQFFAPIGGNVLQGAWYLDLVGAPAANYSVGSTTLTGNALMVIVCADFDGGTFVSDTYVTRTSGTSNTATTGTATNAGDVSTLLVAGSFDVNATVSTPPSGMTLQQFVDGDSSELAVYSEEGFTTGTKSIVWSTSEDWDIYGVVVRYTAPVAGPTITTQPSAATAIVTPSQSAAFTVDCDAAVTGIQWQDDGTNISGADVAVVDALASGGSTLTLTPTATTRTGSAITAECTDANGMTESSAATLTVRAGVTVVNTTTTTDGSGQTTGTLKTDVQAEAVDQLVCFVALKLDGVAVDGVGCWLAGTTP